MALTVKTARRRSRRFDERRDAILEAASRAINAGGAQGLTFAAVARPLGIDTSTLVYYFPTKDELIAACLERSVEALHDFAVEAAAEPTPAARMRAFLRAQLALHRRQRNPESRQLPVLSDLRTLPEALRAPLDARYRRTLHLVRGFFDPGEDSERRAYAHVSAVLLLTNVHWVPGWIPGYDVDDFARIEDQLVANLTGGFGFSAQERARAPLPMAQDVPLAGFLRVATRLINAHGYRGASVERIASELGLATGTFYHHLANKDDLVVACFRRGFEAIRAAARLADHQADALGRHRVAQMLGALIQLQLEPDTPLMRISAYQALPEGLRAQMLLETTRVTNHIAGLIADGVADRSISPRDPLLTAYGVSAAIEAAAALRTWQPPVPGRSTAALLMDVLGDGIRL